MAQSNAFRSPPRCRPISLGSRNHDHPGLPAEIVKEGKGKTEGMILVDGPFMGKEFV